MQESSYCRSMYAQISVHILLPFQAAVLAPLDEDLSQERQSTGSSKVPDFPSPAGREILLRTCVPRPAPYSKTLPQRLFCVMLKDEFRLAGAFSSDTCFF